MNVIKTVLWTFGVAAYTSFVWAVLIWNGFIRGAVSGDCPVGYLLLVPATAIMALCISIFVAKHWKDN